MANLEITIKNGKFVETNHVNVEEFSDTYVRGNGWECFIADDGKIKCQAVKKYSEEFEERIYCVINTKGASWLKYRETGKPPELLKRRYVVPEGVSIRNGMLGLSDGEIKKRHVYFRQEALQNFLDEYGISKIKKANPNKTYQGYLAYNDNENHYSNIVTDGDEEIIRNTPDEKEKLTKSLTTISDLVVRCEKVEVQNATWVLKTIRKRVGEDVEFYRILYSLANFKDLNIPAEYKVK